MGVHVFKIKGTQQAKRDHLMTVKSMLDSTGFNKNATLGSLPVACCDPFKAFDECVRILTMMAESKIEVSKAAFYASRTDIIQESAPAAS